MEITSQIEQLLELKQLYEQGILTKEEMEAEKKKILGAAAPKAESPNREIQPVETTESSDTSTFDDNHNHKNKVILGFATVVVAIIVAVIALYFNKQKEPKEVATDQKEMVEVEGEDYNTENNGNTNESTIEKPERQVIGILKAYYAKKDFSITDYSMNYKQGQLICDSNDPINRIVEVDDYNYKYEGDDTDCYYSYLIPKAEVTKKEYLMHQLTTNDIGNKSIFVSDEGCKIIIFRSNINGHHYLDYDGEVDLKETNNHKECYVLSMRFFDNACREFPLREKQGIIELYQRETKYNSGFNEDPNYCRYREGPIGIIEEEWENGEGWDNDKSAYDESGYLLVDQKRFSLLPYYISIAYIANIDAIYIDGDLYYRKQ